MAFVFGVVDYVAFVAVLLISLIIGLFYGMKGKNRNTTVQYILAGKKMKPLPVALSLLASGQSAVMLVGMPAEVYFYSAQYLIHALAWSISDVFLAFVVVPFIHQLKLPSANKMQYLGVVLLASAVAIETVMDIPKWASILTIASLAIVYTACGGLKAVVWTDVFQAMVMYVGVIVFIVKLTLDIGDLSYIWEVNKRGGRLDMFNFDMDPRARHTFWNLSIRGFIAGLVYFFSQTNIQRISSTPNIKAAKRAFLLLSVQYLISVILVIFEGLVIYAYYSKIRCDPLESKQISDINQILPFVVMDVFRGFPGLSGIFISAIVCASLSTVTTLIGSSAVIIWEDLLKECIKQTTEARATMCNRFIGSSYNTSVKISDFCINGEIVVVGMMGIAVTFLIKDIKGSLPQIVRTISASTDGSVFGLFLVGCMCFWFNKYGAMFGGITSVCFGSWITLGKLFSDGVRISEILSPAPIDGCSFNIMNNTNTSEADLESLMSYINTNKTDGEFDGISNSSLSSGYTPIGLDSLYSLSYMWFIPLSVLTIFIVGSIVSIASGGNNDKTIRKHFVIPMSDWCNCFTKLRHDRCESNTESVVGETETFPMHIRK